MRVVQIALVTMVVATVHRDAARARRSSRSRGRWAAGANILMLIPLVTPEIVAGVSALLLFAQLGIAAVADDDHPRPHHVLDLLRDGRRARRGWPRWARRSRRRRWTSARRRWQTVRLVTLPALWPAILAAALLVFALSFDDFVLSFFTTGESPQPLPVRIYSAMRFGVSPTINAIGHADAGRSRVLAIALAVLLPRLLGRRESGLGGADWGGRRSVTAAADPLRGRHQALRRRPPRSTTSTSTIEQGEFFSLLGPVGLRQDDDAAHDRRLRAARPRARILPRGRAGRRPCRRTGATSTRSSRATRCSSTSTWRTTSPSACKRRKVAEAEIAARAWREALELVELRERATRAAAASSRAASASASRSPARSSTGRRCCCSTSRSARSTSSCASRCRSSSSASSARSGSRSST